MKIGIIGAMKSEVEYLKNHMRVSNSVVIAGQEYLEGKLGSVEAVIVECGVGKVRAAMAAQALCDHFHITHLINTGVAGSLNNEINIGDIVISEDAVFHDVDAVNFGYDLGEVPGVGTLYYKADPMLHDLAVKAVEKVAPDVRAFEGRVATGDSFIRSQEKKQWIREHFDADCTEMEGCAIAETAFLNEIPFVIIRAISDKADESVEESYEIFEEKAAKHCARIVRFMLENMDE